MINKYLVDDFIENFLILGATFVIFLFPNNINAAHDVLVQMSALEKMGVVLESPFKSGPNFSFEHFFVNVGTASVH